MVRRPFAAEELEPGRQEVFELHFVGRVDVVVGDGEGVDRLLVVDAARDLALGVGLGLPHFDRRDLGFGGVFGAAGPRAGAGGARRAVGVEVGFVARLGGDVGAGFGVDRAADVVDARVVAQFEGDRARGGGAEVVDVVPDQRRLAFGRRVGQDFGVARLSALRSAHVGDAFRQHVAEGEVVAVGLAGRVGGGQRHRHVAAVQDAGRGAVGHGDRRFAFVRLGGWRQAERREQCQAEQQSREHTSRLTPGALLSAEVVDLSGHRELL